MGPAKVVVSHIGLTAAAWCSNFLLKPFVSRVNRREAMRIERLPRSTKLVEISAVYDEAAN
jgi:hypothetical protein